MTGSAGVAGERWTSLLPTEEDVCAYEEHGWWVSPPCLSEAVVDAGAQAADRFYEHRDRRLPFASGFSDWTPEDGMDTVRNNEFVSLQSDALAAFACQPIIGAMAARLARTPEIRMLDDQLVYKPAGVAGSRTVVGWHADQAYWGTCSSDRLLTAWIPFHDIDEERGTLVVLDGSHRWDESDHIRSFNDDDLGSVERTLRSRGRELVRVPIELRRGQISFHHGRTIHASYPNRSDRPRLALAVHLQDRDNHYRHCSTPDGREVHMFSEQLCRRLDDGNPDLADPDVFPTIWREPVCDEG